MRIITLSSAAISVFLQANFSFDLSGSKSLSQPITSYPWSWKLVAKHIFNVDMVRYAASKAGNALFALKLQHILDEQRLSILSLSVHPGAVDTGGAYDVGGRIFHLLQRSSAISPLDGAITALFAATSPTVRKNSSTYAGKFLIPFGEVDKGHQMLTEEDQVSGLWNVTQSEVNMYLQKNGLPSLLAW